MAAQQQFSYGVWSLIFSMLEPFDKRSNEENLIMENIKSWTCCRSRSRSIHDGLKYGITRLDLSGCVSLPRKKMVARAINQIVNANSVTSNGVMIKTYERCSWNDEALINSSDLLRMELERQDKICELLVKYLIENFACLTELNLNGLHRLRQDQLESISFNELKSLSISHCRNVKQLNLDKFGKLERISIHVSQIELRINLLEQIANKENENSERIPELVVDDEGGYEVIIRNWLSQATIPIHIYIDYSYRTIDLERVCERSRDVSMIKLIFAGKALENERYLVDYSITKGTTLHYVKP
ncbi:predicted protein [Naegleria gruberi]|uniref:Predicted protein n=1 Tax=Naegleria gruberi TaxID=5762 RepID=D2VJV3_NAEGR|nr:uncharacterized protein NAEGRDRAFT_50147 [Naegleria gruberi]EFC42754.1 predicted protein [Naegleria gruberi]|eukprot:XP_002675498.1 predicted protein [Naegleria gruberi strain NEG-M]